VSQPALISILECKVLLKRRKICVDVTSPFRIELPMVSLALDTVMFRNVEVGEGQYLMQAFLNAI
jgi:hypothetical protein